VELVSATCWYVIDYFWRFLNRYVRKPVREEYNLITTGEQLPLKVGLEFKEDINSCSPSVRYNEKHFLAHVAYSAPLTCLTLSRIYIVCSLSVLGVFWQLRKANVSCFLSVCLSIRMTQLGSHWRDFHDIGYMRIFRKSVGKTWLLLKSDKNNGHFTWRHMYIYDSFLLNSSYNEKYFRQNS
jgi:hypothetical protein